jgi:hypothetical protein
MLFRRQLTPRHENDAGEPSREADPKEKSAGRSIHIGMPVSLVACVMHPGAAFVPTTSVVSAAGERSERRSYCSTLRTLEGVKSRAKCI